MNFCSHCGSNQIQCIIPEGDEHLRQVCGSCGTIHYLNPKVVVGAVTTYENKFLLCKRAILPRKDTWTFPAGFMENNESLEEGAIREAYEEAKATIQIQKLIGTYSLSFISQVYVVFLAKMTSKHYAETIESSEVKLVTLQDIPWDELAFPVIKRAMQAAIGEYQLPDALTWRTTK